MSSSSSTAERPAVETTINDLITDLGGRPPLVVAGFLGTLSDGQLADLSSDELLLVLRGWEAVMGFAAVVQARALRALAERIVDERGPQRGTLLLDAEIAEELGLAVQVSAHTAGARMGFADGLALLPRVSLALECGSLGVAHARVLVDLLTSNEPALTEPVRLRLEDDLVRYATTSLVTPGQLRRRAQKLLLAADPEGARRRRERARRRRYVSCRADDYGMAWLSAYLPTEVAQACFGALDSAAQGRDDPDDERGVGARRADALVDRVLSGFFDGNPPPGAAPALRGDIRINVTVPLSTLTGLTDSPGEVSGFGFIDADHVRELAYSGDATWRRLLTDPAGETLLDVQSSRYRPPARLDRFVRLRDMTCRWPGCEVPASKCDLDHTRPWPEGSTSAGNLVALCRRHHRLKTLAGFTTERSTTTWQVSTPLGRVVSTGPPRAPAPRDGVLAEE